MNGGQDLGGMMGFGQINPENDESFFHSDWERRVLALTLAMGATGNWNIDQSRHARESIDPGKYLTWSYYRIWLEGLETLIIEAGLANSREIANGKSELPPASLSNKLLAENVETVLASGGPASRQIQIKARYQIADKIRTRNINPSGHTRLARYLRGHEGEIVHIHGTHVFPDANADNKGESPQFLYTVRFSAGELWGNEAKTGDFVHADLWESYLKPLIQTPKVK